MNAELKPEQDIVRSILTAYERFIDHEERSTPSNRANCYASGYELCDRKLVLQMTQGDKVLPFPTEVKAKFRRGKDRERNTIMDLMAVGRYAEPPFEIIAQQKRFELRDHKGRIAITGLVDLMLSFGRNQPTIPGEIKDFHTNITDRIETFDDVLRGKWTQKAARQLLCYLYGSGEPMGILIFTRPGLPKLIPVYLYDHLDLVEEFLNKAESALDHKEAGTLPDYIQDAAECKRCYFFGTVCNPPLSSGEGAQIFTDPETEQRLLRYLEIEPVGEEYEALDKWVKSSLRGVESGIAGSVFIQGKWGRNTGYDLPKDVKEQIEVIKAPYKKVDEKGRFSLSITKVG